MGGRSKNPEFRYNKDGDYVGERCPECDMELRIEKLGPRPQYLWCGCGYRIRTKYWVMMYYHYSQVDPLQIRYDWQWDEAKSCMFDPKRVSGGKSGK